jgi:predicted nucleic acid-binding Zn ribbon protein
MDNIKNIVDKVIGSLANRENHSQTKIYRLWDNIATSKEREHSQMVGIKEQKAYVNIDSPTWLYHFKSQKNKILDRIKESIPDLQGVVFRIGKIK